MRINYGQFLTHVERMTNENKTDAVNHVHGAGRLYDVRQQEVHCSREVVHRGG